MKWEYTKVVISIGTANLFSLSVSNTTGKTSSDLKHLTEQLSSGLRINRFGDDSAGSSVASQAYNKSKVLTQGSRNINDAISLNQVADSALSEVQNILTRLAELAEQSANGALSQSERDALNESSQQLQEEISRILKSTKFNDISLFDNGSKATGASTQISGSFNGGAGRMAISADGRYVAYQASGTLYHYDTKTGLVTELEGSGAGSRNSFSISQDGNTVLFERGEDLFTISKDTGVLTQLTNTQGANTITDRVMSLNGSTVAFVTDTQYVDGGVLADGATETATSQIYTIDLETGRFNTVSSADISQASSYGAFELSPDGQNLAMINNFSGSQEVYYADLSKADPTLTQVTTGFVSIFLNTQTVAVSNSGKIYFASDQNWGGANSAGDDSIMEYDTSSGAYRNITGEGVNIETSSANFALTGDGNTITFFSTEDITGENPDTYQQVFQVNTFSSKITQITDGSQAVDYKKGEFAADGLSYLADGVLNLHHVDLSKSSTDLNISTGTEEEGIIETKLKNLFTELRGIGAYDIASATGGQSALDKFKELSDDLSSIQGEFGSLLSRLQSAYETTVTQADEQKALDSTIRDLDFAQATSEFISLQIRQNAEMAVLAQANQTINTVLQLFNTKQA